ncbi:MAG TPA: pyruvate, phosphate dikinase, partial [Armatimonadetes bacterium]|nr:pyruvate, phosphate dikinase [Armatimonadota bacterium]
MAKKYVYLFEEGNKDLKNLLGGKGANLAEMTNLGLPVPYGFTITTEACIEYLNSDPPQPPEGLEEQVQEALKQLERKAGRRLGDPENPLLVSVRSGARASMPGMMDTVLNLGLNDQTVQGLARLTGDERFAYDSYRRFIMMFSDVVLSGIYFPNATEDNPSPLRREVFEERLREGKARWGVREDPELPAEALKELCAEYKEIVREATGREFPSDPQEQLRLGIEAVFRSWNNPRAKTYRRLRNIPDDWGTAVNVQMMVFGNMGDDSGTGVAFTRDPATGEDQLYAEYLPNAQGEDVVAGVRTPQDIDWLAKNFPEVHQQFAEIAKQLERHYHDMQDVEFTVERGKLWMLQTRNGKRTGQAALKIAVDMLEQGLLKDHREALLQVENAGDIEQVLHPQFDEKARPQAIAKGVNASPGAGVGRAVFSADEAARRGGREK